MKKFDLPEEEEIENIENIALYVGTAPEIKALYRALNKRSSFAPCFSDFPKFNSERVYGIHLYVEKCPWGYEPRMSIMGEDVVLRTLAELSGIGEELWAASYFHGEVPPRQPGRFAARMIFN